MLVVYKSSEPNKRVSGSLSTLEVGVWKLFCSEVTSNGSHLDSAVLGGWSDPTGGSIGRCVNSEFFPRPQQGLCAAAAGRIQKLCTFLWQQREPEGLTSVVGSSRKGKRDLCCSLGL